MIKRISVGLVALALVFGVFGFSAADRANAQTAAVNQGMTLSQLVELFINLGIIPADKADAARAAVGTSVTPPTTTQTGGSGSVSAVTTGASLVSLTYDSAHKESALNATVNVTVTAMGADAQVYMNSAGLYFIDQAGHKAYAGNVNVIPLVKNNQTSDTFGRAYAIVSAGQPAVFQVTGSVNPKVIFGGNYHAELQWFYVNSGDSQGDLNQVSVPANRSNSVMVIGETSPYIASASPTTVASGGSVTLYGQRMTNVSSVFIDGSEVAGTYHTNYSSSVIVTLPSSITSGIHVLQVRDSSGQSSNSINVTVSGGTSVPPVPPMTGGSVAVNIVGTPFIGLSYDSANRESKLTATWNLSVTAGSSGASILSGMANAYFADQNNRSVGSLNSLAVQVGVASGEKTDSYGRDYVQLAPGQTLQMTVTAIVNPHQMFAGSYHGVLGGIYLLDSSVAGGSILISSLTNTNNSQTIVGETSPYITAITPNTVAAGGTFSVVGQRIKGSTVLIDGGPVSATLFDGSTIMVVVPSFLASGSHTVQLKDINNQASNILSFVVSGTSTSQPTITLLMPNGGDTLNVGQTYPIRWTSSNVPPNTTVGIQLSYNRQGQTFEDVLASNLPNTGSYSWSIPSTYLSSQIASNAFKLRVILYGPSIPGTNGPQDYSDGFFSIAGSQSLGKVLYPNGGETINLAGSFMVTFTPASGQSYSLNLVDESTDHAYDLSYAAGLTNGRVLSQATDKQAITVDGTKLSSFNIPSGSDFKIEMCTVSSGCITSASPFTVVAAAQPAVGPIVTLNGTPSLSLAYGGAGGSNSEASLVGSQSVTITAGTNDTYVSNMIMGMRENSGVYLPHGALPNSTSYSFTASMNAQRTTVIDAYGNNQPVWRVPAGQSATFQVQVAAQPQYMYAGNYSAYMAGVTTLYNGTYVNMTISPTYSSGVTIVGEKGAPSAPVTGTETIAPNNQTVASGQAVQLNFTYPSNTVRATLYISCPSGVGIGAAKGNITDCNTTADVTNAVYAAFQLINNTASAANVVPNYYIYTSDNPNFAKGVSAQVTVQPAPQPSPVTPVPVPTPTVVPTPTPTPTPVTTTPVTDTQSITPATQTVASGQPALINLTFPSNTFRSSMALSCPPGVTVIASKANVDVKCNSMFDTTKNSAVSVTLQNTASGDKVVVSKYYVYTSDNPNFAKLVSAQITVQAAPATSAATTTAVSSAQSSLNLGSAFVSIDKVLKLFGVER